MEELLAKFTDASTYQYLAAAVALVWLVGVTGIRRGRGRSADASLPKMAMWFAVAMVTVALLYSSILFLDPFVSPENTRFRLRRGLLSGECASVCASIWDASIMRFDCPNMARAAGGLSHNCSSRGAASACKGRFSNGVSSDYEVGAEKVEIKASPVSAPWSTRQDWLQGGHSACVASYQLVLFPTS